MNPSEIQVPHSYHQTGVQILTLHYLANTLLRETEEQSLLIFKFTLNPEQYSTQP
jgi:hypothetical protein